MKESIKESFLNTLLKKFPNGSVNVFDTELRYVLAEGKGLLKVGLSSEQLVGKTLAEVFPAEAVALTIPFYRRAFAGEECEFELRFNSHTYSIFATPLEEQDGKVSLILALVQDITERKRREFTLAFLSSLQEDFARFLSVAEIIQVAGARIAAQLNLSHCLFVEISEAADEAKVFHDHHAPDLQDLSGVYHLTEFHTEEERMQLVSGRAVVINDVRDNRSSAAATGFEALSVRSLVTAPYVSNGRWKFALSAQHRHHYEWPQDEIELLTELAARIYLRIERARAEEALRDADRRKDEFLAMLAHELRNPLAPIRNAVEILKHLGINEPKVKWSGEVINRQVEHLTRLVDDLLDVSRITRGKIELRKEMTDLMVVIGRALEASRPLIDARRQNLVLELPPESLRVEGDVTRLAQVISNLLNNASKYSDEGGHLQFSATRAEEEVILSVRDDGMGIAAETLPHVFELFTHGGKVEALSDGPGKGSEFIVRLPVVVAVHESSKTAPNATGPSKSTKSHCRILVVDDNLDSAQSMALLLELEGHEVQMALDGPQALERAQTFRPQVIVLDIGLPGLNGYEVARQVRSDPEMKQTVLIALTGYGRAEDRARSKEAGFDHHLTKPVNHDLLSSLIKSMIFS
jgi:PAS domain S-box-containing protein